MCCIKHTTECTAGLQKVREISNKPFNLIPKGTKKRKHPKPKISISKEIIKIESEINEIDSKKTPMKLKTSS